MAAGAMFAVMTVSAVRSRARMPFSVVSGHHAPLSWASPNGSMCESSMLPKFREAMPFMIFTSRWLRSATPLPSLLEFRSISLKEDPWWMVRRRRLPMLDFDGVLNAFPDAIGVRYEDVGVAPVVECRGRMTDDFGPERAFRLDGVETVRLGRRGGTWHLHWSRELAANLYGLAESGAVDLRWLSTWQPYVHILDGLLGWDPDVVHNTHWYDPLTGRRMGGKLHAVVDEVIRQLRVADAGRLFGRVRFDARSAGRHARSCTGTRARAPCCGPVRGRRSAAASAGPRYIAPGAAVVIYSDTMHEDGVTADRLHDIDRLPDMTGHRGL